MLGAQLNVTDRTAAVRSILSPPCSSYSVHLVFTVRLGSRMSKRCRPGLETLRITCNNNSSSRSRSSNADDDHPDHHYLHASLLLSETISHYRMQRRGFQPETKWQGSGKLRPFSVQASRPRNLFDTLGQNFLQRFRSPTIFLKISCDGDFLLPIVVGKFSIENLIDAQWGDENTDSPDQFHFLRNLVEKFGYQVNMVRITERVLNTYFARLYFSKLGENGVLSVDARPSDAINVAHRCKAPIYVNKHIVLTDAVRISYGMGRVRDTKSTYDVSLDSAAEGPDFLIQELDLVKNISLAIQEERYQDAAMLRDKLAKLRKSIQGP